MKTGKKPQSLEKEVIMAVIFLYLILCGALLGIHYFQPLSRITQTSSSSPSHEHFSANAKSDKSGEIHDKE
jgi:hypothetical protein